MKLGLAQINCTVGDLQGNVSRCLDAIAQAAALGADLILLPEMAVPGYPPRDLLYDPAFVEAAFAATADLASTARNFPPVLVGSIAASGRTLPGHPGLYNAAILLQDGRPTLAATKRLLPIYDVFLEPRWFLPGDYMPPLEIGGMHVGVLICEDMWDEGYPFHPPQDLRDAGADLLLCLSDLPFRKGTVQTRLYHARRHGLPLALVNLVGGNDELIFDGHSFVLDGSGQLAAQLAGFEEEVRVVEIPARRASAASGADAGPDTTDEVDVFRALVLGLRDFARKNRLKQALIGLSGGIDSSVAAVLTVEALGAGNVTAVTIPSRYTDPRSTAAAGQLAAALGIKLEAVEMESVHSALESSLGNLLEGGSAAENVQARLRMLILMAFANKSGGFLVNTSNKTELTLGYGTLYGDLAGAISPLGDLTKPEVYSLAKYINACMGRDVIPPFTLERAPSAELKPVQVDPFDYAELAPQLEQLVLGNRSNPAIRASEHKRRQFGIILKISDRSFGSGRLVPIARG